MGVKTAPKFFSVLYLQTLSGIVSPSEKAQLLPSGITSHRDQGMGHSHAILTECGERVALTGSRLSFPSGAYI